MQYSKGVENVSALSQFVTALRKTHQKQRIEDSWRETKSTFVATHVPAGKALAVTANIMRDQK
jgi:hypothetical protein